MGSVKYQKDGKQKHWSDEWHKNKVNRVRRLRQKKSLSGQKSLFDDEPSYHPGPTQEKR